MIIQTRHNDAKGVIQELSRAGATFYGLLKSESRYLPHVLHQGEHVQAVIYGQHHNSSVMLVATDDRILFIDKKIMVTLIDEITYDVVSGVELDIHTLFATVTLHTAVANYEIRFVNIHCADHFTGYIEEQRVRREKVVTEALGNNHLIQVKTSKGRFKRKRVRRLANIVMKNYLYGYYWPGVEPDENRERPTLPT